MLDRDTRLTDYRTQRALGNFFMIGDYQTPVGRNPLA
jgi:hypothetical protein